MEDKAIQWRMPYDTTMIYREPVSGPVHHAFVERLWNLGQIDAIPPIGSELMSKRRASTVEMSREGAEYYFAGLILGGLTSIEADARMREIEIS
jgi:hypothetical protein